MIEAAVRCIQRYGAERISVEDIADAAGISRRTLYRAYPSRRAIMETVLMDRLNAMALKVQAALAQCNTFEDKVVFGTLETFRLVEADKIYTSLVSADPALVRDRQHSPLATALAQLFLASWGSVFEDAQEKGLLRPDITLAQAEEWMLNVHILLDVRLDMSEKDRVDLLRNFVLPSLMRVPAA